MRAKDVRGVLRALAPLRPRLVVTAVDDPGASAPDELAAAWHAVSGARATVAATPAESADTSPSAVPFVIGRTRGSRAASAATSAAEWSLEPSSIAISSSPVSSRSRRVEMTGRPAPTVAS